MLQRMNVDRKAVSGNVPVMAVVVYFIAADVSAGVGCYAGKTQTTIVNLAVQFGPGESSSPENYSNNQSKLDVSIAWHLMEQITSRTKCTASSPDRISKLLTCIDSLELVPGAKACRDSGKTLSPLTVMTASDQLCAFRGPK
jgi:hypothetical protein